MVNPYQSGYPAVPPPPPGPGWGGSPNYLGAQQFAPPQPAGGGRAAVDIIAGIALAVAALVFAGWMLVADGFFQEGSIPLIACIALALVGGSLVAVVGTGSVRIRTIAALGAGALLLPLLQQIRLLCFHSQYVQFSEGGNWLVIPTTIALLTAIGTLIAGRSADPAAPWPPAAPGYPAPHGYPGGAPADYGRPGGFAPMGYPAQAPAPGMPASGWAGPAAGAPQSGPVAPSAYPGGPPGTPAVSAGPDAPTPSVPDWPQQ